MNRKDWTYVIAEAGVNHNGRLDLAKDLVTASAEAGVDAVKFQTFETDRLVAANTEVAEYQKRSTNDDQYEMLSALELDSSDFEELKAFCERQGVDFVSTPYDRASVDVLEELDVDRIKIASADIVHKPLLEQVAATDTAVILSTGMASMEEIAQGVGWVRDAGGDELSLLHCVSEYPTDIERLDLRFMETLDSVFDVPVGLSDHTLGVTAPVAAVSMGAQIVEKHVTLDSKMEGPDHEASLEPDELERMIDTIRDVEAAMGSPMKVMSDDERSNATRMRRSLHSACDLKKGANLDEESLAVLRPVGGIEPRHFEEIRGRELRHAKQAGEPITWSDIA